MKKKYITTSRLKKWRVLDALSLAVPLYLTARFLFASFADSPAGVSGGFWVLVLLCVVCSFVVTVPVVLLWRAVSRPLKRSEMKRATFRATADLDYYRDKLTGLSPADISILTDLQLEPQKDLAAQLLYYRLLGVARQAPDGTLLVGRAAHPALRPSDTFLLEALRACGTAAALPAHTIREWAQQARAEVFAGEWFRRRGPDKKFGSSARGCATGCLLPLAALLGSCGLMLRLDLDFFLNAFPDDISNAELALALSRDPQLLRQGLLLFLLGGVGLAAVYWPLAWLICGVLRTTGRTRTPYLRTAAGEEMTEYVYGMKNFLHDFSLLSEADKDHLALWDDFLVYAVVLEENSQIVRDVFRRRGLPCPCPAPQVNTE